MLAAEAGNHRAPNISTKTTSPTAPAIGNSTADDTAPVRTTTRRCCHCTQPSTLSCFSLSCHAHPSKMSASLNNTMTPPTPLHQQRVPVFVHLHHCFPSLQRQLHQFPPGFPPSPIHLPTPDRPAIELCSVNLQHINNKLYSAIQHKTSTSTHVFREPPIPARFTTPAVSTQVKTSIFTPIAHRSVQTYNKHPQPQDLPPMTPSSHVNL